MRCVHWNFTRFGINHEDFRVFPLENANIPYHFRDIYRGAVHFLINHQH